MACIDPAEAVITAALAAMRFVYDPTSDCPPLGGGSLEVHFVGGEGPMWDPAVHMNNDECDKPFLWVRMASRYRSRQFPAPDALVTCDGLLVIPLELGVARCSPSSLEAVPDWADVSIEADIGRDDSYRLDRAVCALRGLLPNQLIAAEPILPMGPDGGGIVWTTNLYVGLASDQE